MKIICPIIDALNANISMIDAGFLYFLLKIQMEAMARFPSS